MPSQRQVVRPQAAAWTAPIAPGHFSLRMCNTKSTRGHNSSRRGSGRRSPECLDGRRAEHPIEAGATNRAQPAGVFHIAAPVSHETHTRKERGPMSGRAKPPSCTGRAATAHGMARGGEELFPLAPAGLPSTGGKGRLQAREAGHCRFAPQPSPRTAAVRRYKTALGSKSRMGISRVYRFA